MLQIVQFVIDLFFVYFASYSYFTSTYFPWMPRTGNCAGEEFAAFAGMGILSSYLLLFISFYFATYKKEKKVGKRHRRSTSTQATIDMARFEIPGNEKKLPASPSNGSASAPKATSPPVTRSRKA